MHSARPDAQVEGLWVCVHGDGVRRPIDASTCETCPYWEYEVPLARFNHGSSPEVSVQSQVIPACPYESRAEKRIEIGTRVAALALSVLLAGMGFVVWRVRCPAHHHPVDGRTDIVLVGSPGTLQPTGQVPGFVVEQ